MLVKKEKGYKRKLYHFINLINEFMFYESQNFIYNGFKGVLYYIEPFRNFQRCDSQKQFEFFINKVNLKYDNTKIFYLKSEYAPEQKKTALFIAYKEVTACKN